MKISKEFRWEMGHRLPLHDGLCKNVHGHSYKLLIEISGEVSENGMIIDFFDLSNIIKPILDNFDHAFMCSENDLIMKNFLEENNMKRVIVKYPSTVENICNDLVNRIYEELRKLNGYNLNEFFVRIFESPNAYAELSKTLL